MDIRDLKPEDAGMVSEIYNYYVLNSVASFETAPVGTVEMRKRLKGIIGRYPAFAAFEDGRMVGYCYAHAWRERAAYSHTWEATIYLDHNYTGHGLGMKMMQELMRRCSQEDCHALIADITASNQASIRMCEKLGFHQIAFNREVGYKFGQVLSTVYYEYIFPTHRFHS